MGERLIASVATGPEVSGSVVPSSAVVLSGGEAWCYVRSRTTCSRGGASISDGHCRRATSRRRASTPGEHVVVAGAGLLLAREIGGGAEAD